MIANVRTAAIAAGLAALMTACATHERYVPPAIELPPQFKEDANWKPAQPADTTARGSWWQLFGDPALNALETEAAAANQTIQAAAARFAASRAALRGTRALRAPDVQATPTIVREQQSGNRASSARHVAFSDLVLPLEVSYEADIWGRVRQSVLASRGAAEASAADVAATTLSIESELAIDYFALHAVDREQQLLDDTVAAYQRAVELTQNRFTGGLASAADVAQATTQLEATRAQAVDLGAARANLEHAIAALVGRPASSFSLPPSPLDTPPPAVPPVVPSAILERRPDVAAAERRVASASAGIGVATSALYPRVTLSGAVGFEASAFGSWLAAASNFWSIAPAAAINVFDGGRRRAAIAQARARYAESLANYRESVLSAFREVEDQLATLRVLEEESRVQDRAVAAAGQSLTLANNRYRGGVASYLEVVTAQSAALANQRTAVNLLQRRLMASVLLIEAIGGGWDRSMLNIQCSTPNAPCSRPNAQ
jgi:NodT family efflux transporter outer membrane factor (OMF) lipoprotein